MNAHWHLIILFVSLLLLSINNVNAIDVTSCTNITSSGKYDLVNNISSQGDCLSISGTRNIELDCRGNTIMFTSLIAIPSRIYSGIQINDSGFSASNITIKNCNIIGTGSWLIGIYSNFFVSDVFIFNNSITLNGPGPLYGIYLDAGNHHINVSNNLVNLESTRPYLYGVFLTATDFVTINENFIEVNSHSAQSFGIHLSVLYSPINSNTRILRNTIKTGFSYAGANHGIYSLSGRDIVSKENKIYATGVNTKALLLYSTSGTFDSDELYNPSAWIYSDSSFDINFTNISFITDYGSIKISSFRLDNPAIRRYDISKFHLDITQNKAYKSSYSLPELNKSSIITLLNTGIMNPMIEADYLDAGRYSLCLPPSCRIISSINGNVTFSVNHFTAYRVAQLTCPLCGDVNMDGVVNSADALVDARIANRLIVPNPLQFVCGDVNSDGAINVLDALLIARKSAGFSVTLRCA